MQGRDIQHQRDRLLERVDSRFSLLFEIIQKYMIEGEINKEAETQLTKKHKNLLNTFKKRIREQRNRQDSAARVVITFIKKFFVREMRSRIKHGKSTNPAHYITSLEVSWMIFREFFSKEDEKQGANPKNIWGVSRGPTLSWFKKFTANGTNFNLYDKILELLCDRSEPILHFYKQDKIVKNCKRFFSGLPEDEDKACSLVRKKLRVLPKNIGEKQFCSQPKFPLTLANFKTAIAQTVLRLKQLKKCIEDCSDNNL